MSGMYYLFFQIWVWLLITFTLGWLAHAFLCKRKYNCEHSDEVPSVEKENVAQAPVKVAESEPAKISDAWKPTLFTQAPDTRDELKRIKGIGPVIEKTLNELGVYQFKQIADWSDDNCAWVDNFLAFPGRISREDWVEQATALASGQTTEFSKRVDKGDVNYN